MELSQRHRMILKALIDEFIDENRPVGSKTLFDKHDIGLSPASIRAVLKDLEDMGFLASRHTSGGRIPTEQGYRFYVDSLLVVYELTLKEKQRIQEEYLKMQFRLDQILKATASVLASLSNTAGIVIGPAKSLDTLKHVELIHVHGDEVLMIMVMRSGAVVHRNVFLDRNYSQEELYQISKYLNENAKGYDMFEIQESVIPKLLNKKDGPEDFYKVSDVIAAAMTPDNSEVSLYIDGLKNLYGRFRDEEKQLNQVLSLLDDKRLLREFFGEHIDHEGVITVIGKEGDGLMDGVAIITSNYRMGEKRIGTMGIIGPQRMDYNRALPLVDFTSKLVSEMITRISR
ncbi:heat-inducible transcription repressor HrcA [Leptospira perolatii]|uniref:Heat-inducible transcription repressor HrcA n=1 Tax=Leptospira perolatii TaxID=2023191 RepID=A0A2M9ZT68_9LEPT|nr:heat-inducible transcriptional repressor HrcA [Leptospira perolatii]PJZ71589.1 heat-inducible transcription repressor HrcA [Leptospira perolatii]PJZ75204.1 heat-inducible transcription repressor HrcA [Leptospira perolatii]